MPKGRPIIPGAIPKPLSTIPGAVPETVDGSFGPTTVAPLSVLPTDEELRAWLMSKHTSLWGESFSIIEGKEGPALAVEYIQKQIRSFLEWRSQQGAEG